MQCSEVSSCKTLSSGFPRVKSNKLGECPSQSYTLAAFDGNVLSGSTCSSFPGDTVMSLELFFSFVNLY